jgi:hypothetical protein
VLFSDDSGFVSNVFHFENEWNRPSNLLIPEILFYLASSRKRVGQIGVEGYFTVERVCEVMQRIGFDPQDAAKAINYVLRRNLIDADHMGNISVNSADSIKISAAGYIHLRTLVERIEYLYGVITATRITDDKALAVFADAISREMRLGDLSARSKVQTVVVFNGYLLTQAKEIAESAGRKFDLKDPTSGAAYVLRAMDRAISRFNTRSLTNSTEPDPLD